jgi:hypothetical protein
MEAWQGTDGKAVKRRAIWLSVSCLLPLGNVGPSCQGLSGDLIDSFVESGQKLKERVFVHGAKPVQEVPSLSFCAGNGMG